MLFQIQELFIDHQSDNEACAIFYYHGWSDGWIKCSERFPDVLGKVKLILLLQFPRNMLLSKFQPSRLLHMRNKSAIILR